MLGTANLHSIPQPQISQNTTGWSAAANPQTCSNFCPSATANDFLLPQTLLLFFPGLINREDL